MQDMRRQLSADQIWATVAFLQSHIDFLLTDALQENPPFKRNAGGFSIQGVGLPGKVAEKICYTNAQKLISF